MIVVSSKAHDAHTKLDPLRSFVFPADPSSIRFREPLCGGLSGLCLTLLLLKPLHVLSCVRLHIVSRYRIDCLHRIFVRLVDVWRASLPDPMGHEDFRAVFLTRYGKASDEAVGPLILRAAASSLIGCTFKSKCGYPI